MDTRAWSGLNRFWFVCEKSIKGLFHLFKYKYTLHTLSLPFIRYLDIISFHLKNLFRKKQQYCYLLVFFFPFFLVVSFPFFVFVFIFI